MASVGRMGEFVAEEESIESYVMRLKHYFKANAVKEENKVSVLITVLGSKNLATLSDLLAPTEVDTKTYDELVKVLKEHFSPKKLVVAERYTFYSRFQKPVETVAEFAVAIKHLATTCSFGTFLKDALRDKLVSGLKNENIRQKLLSEELDFDKALELALRLEQAERQSGIFMNLPQPHGEVSKINIKKSNFSSSSTNKNVNNRQQVKKCYRCASQDHLANNCQYKNVSCHVCRQVGHLAKVCKSRVNNKQGKFHKVKVHQVGENSSEALGPPGVEEFSLYNLSLGGELVKSYKVGLSIEEKLVEMELDTGAALTISPFEKFKGLFPLVEVEPSNVKLVTYAGNEVPVVGQVVVKVAYRNQKAKLPIILVDIGHQQPMLLGRDWLTKFKFDWQTIFDGKASVSSKSGRPKHNISFSNLSNSPNINEPNHNEVKDIIALKDKYKSVFQGGTGEIKGVKANIVLKKGAIPKFCKARTVPFSLREPVEQELDRMVREGVAYHVTKSEWASPLVVVHKPNNKVRLCVDFKVSLNQVIENEHYPLPQAEDIFASLAGDNWFSVVDLASAYQQLVVAEESQHLLTVSTHKGLYRLRRLPFGLSSAPAIFQAAIDQIISGLPGTVAYLDDVLVGGSTREEAYRRLEMVLQRLQEYGVKCNEGKCKFLQKEVEYLGFILTSEGIKPQDSLVQAIKDAPEPTNKDELRAYLGLLNYYGKFVSDLSSRLSCFYDLLKKSEHWNWSPECARRFAESKLWVLNSSLLVHYDVNKPLVLTCDASPKGVGAVLSHFINGEERPIAFASKTLSVSESNYSQLHREALALVFGVRKFHKYIYGRKCVLQTDHQPLTAIFGSKRGIPTLAASRLQRWALILSAYDFEIRYRKGKDVPHADALSRLPLPENEPLELEVNSISHVESCISNCFNLVKDSPMVSASDIARLTDRDPVLAKVRDFVMFGWRDIKDPSLTEYLRRKDELSVDKNCVLWGSRVIIPEKLQPAIMLMLHDQHPGITRMKLLARSFVWWPGLGRDIDDTVSSCLICQCTRNAASKVPLKQWPSATRRWERLHIDFAEDPETRQQMLVLIDSFSKWLEVFCMRSTTSSKTIECLRTLFSSYGLPDQLVSDNGTSFTSAEFHDFVSKNSIKFILTPPYHPESNGAAERAVQEVKKNLLRQVIGQNHTGRISLQHKLDNFLFAYRNTPCTVTGLTPAELFLNWKPRTKLSMLKPNLIGDIEEKRRQQKIAADRHRGKDRFFHEGQKVMVKTVRQEKISWVPGKIIQKRSPVTYLVSVLGKTRFCHVDHLRPFYMEEGEEVTVKPTEKPISRHTSPVPVQKECLESATSPIARPKEDQHRQEYQGLQDFCSPPKQTEKRESPRQSSPPRNQATGLHDARPTLESHSPREPKVRPKRAVRKPQKLDL